MRYSLALGFAALLYTGRASDPAPFLVTPLAFQFEASKTSAKYLIESMGGGVAMFDADGDGLPDLYFVNGAAIRPGMTAPDKSDPRYSNRLYRNNGDGSFADWTAKAGLRGNGYGQGAAIGDCDNDGLPDLYVTAFGANTLYRNRGAAVFEDVTARAAVAGSGWSTSAGFIDYDRDGKLDLFVARYLDWSFDKNKRCGGEGPELQAYCHPNEFPPVTHLLYRNLGGCRFEDVSAKADFAGAPGKGLGVAFEDIDHDGWPDIFVANDSFPQQLFRNRGNGTFEEIALRAGVAYDEDGEVFAGMGTDLADYDNDGWPDLFVNALANQGYSLFRNTKGLFSSIAVASGVGPITKLHSGWGARFIDYDNDGRRDLFVAQGHVMDNIERTQPNLRYRESPLLLRNTGAKFVDTSHLDMPLAARGAAFGDLNNDGAVDIVIATNSGPSLLLRNTATANWLLIDTEGTRSNRDGIGAVVRIVTASGREQRGFVTTAGSYLSAHDKRVHFGLGRDRSVKILEIRWPSGIVQTWKDVAANRIFRAREAAE